MPLYISDLSCFATKNIHLLLFIYDYSTQDLIITLSLFFRPKSRPSTKGNWSWRAWWEEGAEGAYCSLRVGPAHGSPDHSRARGVHTRPAPAPLPRTDARAPGRLGALCFILWTCWNLKKMIPRLPYWESVLRILIRRIRMFLGLLDPNPSIIKPK